LPSSYEGLPLDRKNVIVMGPGLGPATDLVLQTLERTAVPVVLDADALNSIAGQTWRGPCVLTPHPGEMARLTGATVSEVQRDRLGIARMFAQERECTVVLKGNRTVIAFADGRAWINPTGTPGMA